MHYADLVQLYFERSNALQWYWTLYVVIIGGLLAFSSLRVRRDAITGLLVTLLFCMFAYKNLGAIHDTTLQRMAALEAIRQIPADFFRHAAHRRTHQSNAGGARLTKASAISTLPATS